MRQQVRTLGIGGALALALAGCGGGAPPQAVAAPVQVTAMTLRPAPMTVSVDLPGRVAAVRSAQIRPQVGGIVQRRFFEQGADVRRGDALFQINPAPFKAEMDTAAAALHRAQAAQVLADVQHARLQRLVESSMVSRQMYDDAVSQRTQAAAAVAEAKATLSRRRLDLAFATVDAPIDGRIDQALLTEGALVSPSDSAPMAVIQQIDQVYVDVRQSAADLDPLDPAAAGDGLPAQILDRSGLPSGLSGRVLFSGINVDAGTGDVLLRILVDNPQRRLLPGMYVRARVPRAHYAQALRVPQQAVTHVGKHAQVWVLDADARARNATVQLGELVQGHYRVVAGLQAGQQVVVEGIDRLSTGTKVKARAWQPPAVATAAAAAD
ncbi:efflux RND transporter periplasmic adaptor subunit [Xanthomonas rydalmerensis]|uniref:Efflux RND transporter periplasmic adaptor subunit n=1 Tax=Xanthomonas rydalmerensis TaxID=3046274 RepID=A0ABZ0JQF0_9XANT|nr:efflux RND transporter periplasmic adaptor subunit [Xanthomonas sp. DM-2023]WOS41548.1 efflux RND transporter periplasmic adaptor subunit [Xanthomonas sp. DM-2023]WOS45733.1 efflux RND transporter periplasmic adaptor subunit [Xanthomonas sp. DM-2023]WOS49913.1 efflux RND transporter periplasmic adaptor subunit [Xanthomonas sp. DM-2023]WOS54092.1 efflux RND transporter periplasmic adaptor subunit [Xanthomonas sp. DM-2023]WOS58275.1 efflux RND transporter periplasmic adaptor subunit [Xanthomo